MSLRLPPSLIEVCILVVARDDEGRFYTYKGIGRELGLKESTVETFMERAAAAIRLAYPHLGRNASPRRTIHQWYWHCRHEAMTRNRRAA